MPTIYESIAGEAAAMPEGTMFERRRFAGLGSASSVRRALERLCREGRLKKVHARVYMTPQKPKWGAKVMHPSAARVLGFLKNSGRMRYCIHGAMAINLLGISTQVPVGYIYSTTGRSRTVELCNAVVDFVHVPAWQHLFGDTPEGAALIAIGYLGRREMTKRMFAEMAKRLPPESLVRLRNETAGRVPKWVEKIVKA